MRHRQRLSYAASTERLEEAARRFDAFVAALDAGTYTGRTATA